MPRESRPASDRASEFEADRAAARFDRLPFQAGTGSGPRLVRPRGLIQGFGALEHQSLGNLGAGGEHFGSVTQGPAYETSPGGLSITHGDLIMLSGDLFDPRDDAVGPDGKSDSLFVLASRRSTSPGDQPGTDDEIIYAIKHESPADPRFSPKCTERYPDGGPWAGIEFCDEVKNNVTSRYKRMASENHEHFVSPHGGGRPSGLGSSAGGSFRALHEAALVIAFEAGQAGQTVEHALAREAAAQHFLTDAFASGHLRTPRLSISAHWDEIYPGFFRNFKRAIGMKMAIYMNEHSTNVATIFGSVQEIYNEVLIKVEEQTAGLPALGFGDVVSLVAHDLDNEVGLSVTNDIGETWRSYGDSSLDSPDPENRTREMAQLAVGLGISDVHTAYSFGSRAPGPVDASSIFLAVRNGTPLPARSGETNYGPEQGIPRLAADETSEQQYAGANLAELWSMRIRTDIDRTYGQEITASLQGGELGSNLEAIGSDMDETTDAAYGTSTLRPKDAFMNGFLAPLRSSPQVRLQEVVDFNPSVGQIFNNTDDIVMEEVGNAEGDELAEMTINQRSDRVKTLVGGWVAGDEEEVVITLFNTAPAGDRTQIYRQVEGHAWSGDWKQGVFTWDDDIWNALSRDNLTRLRAIINGRTEQERAPAE